MTHDVLPPVVDIHAHAWLPEVAELTQDMPGLAAERVEQGRVFGSESMVVNAIRMRDEWYLPLTELEVRLATMDSSGVDIQMVSMSPTQYSYWADESLACDLVSTANSALANLVARAPTRLAGLATVSLQHPALAAEQLRNAVAKLGMRGVQISTTSAGRDFSHPALDVFWAAAVELDVPVFVHPWGCSYIDRLSSFYLGNVIGQPLETTTALSHLIFGGVLDRYPALNICGAHGGGYLPYYLGRADHAYAVRPESRTMERPPSEYMPRLYFDSLVYRQDELRSLISVAGVDHVLLGTDYPFDMSVPDPLQRLMDLDRESAQAVSGSNAVTLFGLHDHAGVMQGHRLFNDRPTTAPTTRQTLPST